MRSAIGLLILAAIVVKLLPFIAAIAAAIALVWLAVRLSDGAEFRQAAREKLRAELAHRADQQDWWYLQGDPRGIYGDCSLTQKSRP